MELFEGGEVFEAAVGGKWEGERVKEGREPRKGPQQKKRERGNVRKEEKGKHPPLQ